MTVQDIINEVSYYDYVIMSGNGKISDYKARDYYLNILESEMEGVR